jgi:two-component system NarL family sensor kinase
LREIAERLSTVREVERREIAMTLHERAAQDLYAARLAIERLRSSARDVDTEAALGDIHGIIEQAVREIGALTNDLYPTALQHLALPDVLAQHAAKFEQRSGVGVTFEAAEPFPVLHPDVRLLLFRAAQEALTNVWRHARAGHVHMTLTADDAIRLTVEDDGIGLTPGSDMKAGSLGVLGMRERFGALGGGFSLGPSPHGGARLAAWLPARAG